MIAFEIRFCNNRRRSRRSLVTTSEEGTKVSLMPFALATGPNSICTWFSSSLIAKWVISVWSLPVSSREISSSAERISSTALSEDSTLSASSDCGVSLSTSERAVE